MSRSIAAMALLALVGCLGAEPAPEESASSAASVSGMLLDTQMLETIGWNPTGFLSLSARGQSELLDSNSMADGGVVRSLAVVGKRHALQVPSGGIMQLAARSIAIGEVTPIVVPFTMRTQLGLAVFHRARGSRYEWQPLRCESYTTYGAPKNPGPDLIDGGLTIDAGARRLRAGKWYGPFMDIDWYDNTFEQCGIREADPEFSVFVVPVVNWSLTGYVMTLAGHYEYSLEASCDGSYCRPYDFGEGPGPGSRAGDESAGADPLGSFERCDDSLDNDRDGSPDCEDRDCDGAVEWWGEPGELRHAFETCKR